jgi:hypothetical protein
MSSASLAKPKVGPQCPRVHTLQAERRTERQLANNSDNNYTSGNKEINKKRAESCSVDPGAGDQGNYASRATNESTCKGRPNLLSQLTNDSGRAEPRKQEKAEANIWPSQECSRLYKLDCPKSSAQARRRTTLVGTAIEEGRQAAIKHYEGWLRSENVLKCARYRVASGTTGENK